MATRTQNRTDSASFLLWMVYGLILLGAIGSFFQDPSSQGKPWMILFPTIICLLGVYVQRLELRIVALESQRGNQTHIEDA